MAKKYELEDISNLVDLLDPAMRHMVTFDLQVQFLRQITIVLRDKVNQEDLGQIINLLKQRMKQIDGEIAGTKEYGSMFISKIEATLQMCKAKKELERERNIGHLPRKSRRRH